MKSIIKSIQLILTVSIFLVYSCGNNLQTSKRYPIKIQIPNENSDPLGNIDHYFDLEFIPLETSPESFLSDMKTSIFYVKEQYFLVDANVENTVTIFDQQGKFIKKIKSEPHTYNYLFTAFVDKFLEEIRIFDQTKMRQYIYSLNGEYLDSKEISLTYWSENRDKNFIFYDYFGISNFGINPRDDFSSYHLAISSKESSDSIISRLKPYKYHPSVGSINSHNSSYVFKDTLHYYRMLCDTIFKVTNDSIIPKYVLRFNSSPAPENFYLDTIYSNNKMAYCFENNHPFIEKIDERDKYLFITYHFAGHVHFLGYDKIKGKIVFNTKSILHNETGLNPYIPRYSYNGIYYHPTYPSDLKTLFNRAEDKLPEDLKLLGDNLKNNDNPVLVVYRPKG